MNSPLKHLGEEGAQPSEGASRTTGGTIRGKAIGNVFSLADAPDVMQDRIQAQGLVKVYKSCIAATDLVNPSMVVKTEVTPSLVPILKKLSRRYSPVSSKFFIILNFSVIYLPYCRPQPEDLCP
jgi:hypothetical protein